MDSNAFIAILHDSVTLFDVHKLLITILTYITSLHTKLQALANNNIMLEGNGSSVRVTLSHVCFTAKPRDLVDSVTSLVASSRRGLAEDERGPGIVIFPGFPREEDVELAVAAWQNLRGAGEASTVARVQQLSVMAERLAKKLDKSATQLLDIITYGTDAARIERAKQQLRLLETAGKAISDNANRVAEIARNPLYSNAEFALAMVSRDVYFSSRPLHLQKEMPKNSFKRDGSGLSLFTFLYAESAWLQPNGTSKPRPRKRA